MLLHHAMDQGLKVTCSEELHVTVITLDCIASSGWMISE
jgi:uncharacterized protein YjhX (UPF0386 family)